MKVPELPKEPTDGFTIEFWTFDSCTDYSPGPRRHLRIFVLNETWRSWMARPEWQAYHSHRPGEKDSDGAPWKADWMIINQSGDRMQLDGRACGWEALMGPCYSAGRSITNEQKWAELYATREDAMVAFRKHVKEYVALRKNNIRSAIAELRRIEARSTTARDGEVA